MLKKKIAAIIFLYLIYAPNLIACPNCFGASKKAVISAYYISILFMILLPLVIVASIGGWLWWTYRNPPKEEV